MFIIIIVAVTEAMERRIIKCYCESSREEAKGVYLFIRIYYELVYKITVKNKLVSARTLFSPILSLKHNKFIGG